MNAQVNQTAYTLLVEMVSGAQKGAIEVAKAKDKLATAREKARGPYDNAVLAGIACRTPDVFKATMALLMDNIRQNRGGLATKLKAEKREEPGRNGETHKIPSSVSTAKTVILFAMENGVPLELNGKPRTYGEIRDENQSVRDLAKAKIEEERKANATGAEKALYDAQEAIKELTSALPEFSEDWLVEVATQARAAIAGNAKDKAEAEAKVAEAAKNVAKGGEGAGNELAEALKKRQGRKAA